MSISATGQMLQLKPRRCRRAFDHSPRRTDGLIVASGSKRGRRLQSRLRHTLPDKVDRVAVVTAVRVESPLELSIDRDDVDIENASVAVEHVVEVMRDVVHDSKHPAARGLRDPDIRGVENTEHIGREGLIVERGGDRVDEERADRC